MEWTAIHVLVLDVDGVLTDGRLVQLPGGEMATAFHVHDGFAIKLWQRSGGQVAIISGRKNPAVQLRAAELGIEEVHTGVNDKLRHYGDLLARRDWHDRAVAYIGDDLPDVPPMRRCAFPVAVADAAPVVKRSARYVTRRPGGRGAVAETVELLLRKQRKWVPAHVV